MVISTFPVANYWSGQSRPLATPMYVYCTLSNDSSFEKYLFCPDNARSVALQALIQEFRQGGGCSIGAQSAPQTLIIHKCRAVPAELRELESLGTVMAPTFLLVVNSASTSSSFLIK